MAKFVHLILKSEAIIVSFIFENHINTELHQVLTSFGQPSFRIEILLRKVRLEHQA